MNNNIIIKDWVGNILYEGDSGHEDVDAVLDANRCAKAPCDDRCPSCDGTNYIGDFEVYWQDENRKDNVYDFINY